MTENPEISTDEDRGERHPASAEAFGKSLFEFNDPPKTPDSLSSAAGGASSTISSVAGDDAIVPVPPQEDETCWRCGKRTPADMNCRWCQAPLRANSGQSPNAPSIEAGRRVVHLVIGYGVLLIFAAIFGVIAFLSGDKGRPNTLYTFSVRRAVLETLWTLVVLVTVRMMARPPRLESPSKARRRMGWAMALPVLAACLAVNVAYHRALIQFLGSVPLLLESEAVASMPPTVGDITFAIVAICIQPGMVEELFFRYLALGTLRTVMGRHGSVIVSSVMFGVAHIHAPLSIPLLIIVGLGLGYVRLLSGSLIPCMLMHALHNGAVLWLEFAS